MALRIQRRPEDSTELNMGPMIDMVFLLLVFFLVASRPMKEEADLGMQLPGQVEQDTPVDLPDEQQIEILPSGQVVLNEQPLDTPESTDLPTLRTTLRRFKQTADANKAEALVTLNPADEVPHQRIADVMNVCAQVGITGVTFAGSSEEDSF
jgi:biopolymer transport protein ExbD